MSQLTSIRCAACKGVAHPASGCVYGPRTVVCGPCVRAAWAWVRQHTARYVRVGPRGPRARYISFYAAAGAFAEPTPSPVENSMRAASRSRPDDVCVYEEHES